ncbi:MAG: aminopeptidase [Anaerorhabdus sp.]|uniref:aminopeptidase n=1 Tax=Anaerorhabdus sp. TaxID=1872524 RepID=UPI002B208F93|nr:aminopeptidase [Anaerorhabdus sp.]MEA4875835.1 aminopeptidase [Anaerorhabdus sp.]
MITNFEIYAEILLRKGVNLQKGQYLSVSCPVEGSKFMQILSEVAYKLGACYVEIEFFDPLQDQIRYQNCLLEYSESYPEYLVKKKINMANDKVALLKFNPGIIPTVEFDSRIKVNSIKGMNNALKPYTQIKRTKTFNSCSTVLPTRYWASQVFPDLSGDEAYAALWNLLFQIAQCELDNPLDYWENHISSINERRNYLNDLHLTKLHIIDDQSDFTVELPNNHVWVGGCEHTVEGLRCMPNFPTEEIFTACSKYGINGKVHSSKPFIYQNEIIDDFYLIFEKGKIVKAYASVGQRTLNALLNLEEGTRYCGEIALLPGSTIISKTNTIFKNTLLDENAACHMAIGCAYPINISESLIYSATDFETHGINFASIHCDFMFGKEDTTVVGMDEHNQEIQLIQNGKWMF